MMLVVVNPNQSENEKLSGEYAYSGRDAEAKKLYPEAADWYEAASLKLMLDGYLPTSRRVVALNGKAAKCRSRAS
jgi:hypothetical protein